MFLMYRQYGRWTIVPHRKAPRRYRPLREAAYHSWVARGMPHDASGGYLKRVVRTGGGDDGE